MRTLMFDIATIRLRLILALERAFSLGHHKNSTEQSQLLLIVRRKTAVWELYFKRLMLWLSIYLTLGTRPRDNQCWSCKQVRCWSVRNTLKVQT